MFGKIVIVIAIVAAGILAPHDRSVAADNMCAADPAWFSGTTLNVNEPTDPLTNDCGFYQRAWQAFLAVTKVDPATSRARFIDFDSMATVFPPPAANRPMSMFRSSFTTSVPGRMGVALRLAKEPGPIFHEGVQQADDSIVVNRAGKPVFYAIHMDPLFAKFVRDNGLNDPKKLEDASPGLTIAPGSIEMKSAWQVVDSASPPAGFLLTDASVPRLKQVGSDIVGDASDPQPVKLALLGFHVVFALENHPELIWASFEHVSNGEFDLAPPAPAFPDVLDPTQPVSNKNYILYSAGTSAADATNAPAAYTLNDAAQTLSPSSSVYRRFPWSQQIDPDHPDDAKAEDDMVKSVNDEVAKIFAQQATADARSNYKLLGAVWIAKGAADFKAGVKIIDDKLEGENGLSNMAMESFTQQFNPNCFGCHQPLATGGLKAKAINISHIFPKFHRSAGSS
jgi:hypothetical protein